MAKMLLNQELNGVELYFQGKPKKEIITNLKSNGFRFSGFKTCWYAKQNEKTLKFAEELTGAEPIAETITEAVKASTPKQSKNINLWELTTWKEMEVNKTQPTKQIAAEIRKFARSRFPFVKFSVTSTYNSISFYITASPFEKESVYLKAIEEYCTKLLEAYNYCTCYDPYGDYGSSYNFYGSYAKIDYDYTQTEQTEAIRANMINFDQKKAEFEKLEEERKEKEFQEYQKEQKEKERQYKIRAEEEKKEIEVINNSIEIKPLEEEEQYFILGSQFAHLNKNNTLDQYKEEVLKGDFSLEDVKITKEIHFTSKESLNYFSNLLLNDFDFLAGTGGSFTDDVRINSMIDYNNMTKEERETVIFNLLGVAVYYNNELQFVVDAQGYNYARYVGLVEDVKIQKNNIIKQITSEEEAEKLKEKADTLTNISTSLITDLNITTTWKNESLTEYKKSMKDKLKTYNFQLTKEIIQQIPGELEELKAVMYKLLIEVDGIQDQFRDANIRQGDKITVFYLGDWGGMIDQQATFDSVEYKKYAQYEDAVKLTYKPKNKRNLYYKYHHGEILVYKGWLDLPTEVLHTIEKTGTGTVITQTKYLSCDKKQYDEILEHFESQGIKPIVNTYKPTF